MRRPLPARRSRPALAARADAPGPAGLRASAIAVALLVTAAAGAAAGAQAGSPGAAPPDEGSRSPSSTLINLRTGWRHDVTFRHFQGVHRRGRWVVADLGYIDFGDPEGYRELWAGAGRMLHASDRAAFVAEGIVAQASGSKARGETYFQPWFLLWVKLAERWEWETVYLDYLPLDDEGTRQHVLDRSKVEVDLGRFRLGAGYAGFRFSDLPWQHRPFLTATVKIPRAGAVELWAQRLPAPGGGSTVQAQVRYAVTLVR